jgi:hypothetical protein
VIVGVVIATQHKNLVYVAYTNEFDMSHIANYVVTSDSTSDIDKYINDHRK